MRPSIQVNEKYIKTNRTKRLNHLGSAGLLFSTILLMIVLLLPALGFSPEWNPKTTPYRLVNNPFISWSLFVLLCACLALIRMGTEFMQCITALVFVGSIFGVAITSALFWDSGLMPILIFSASPIQRHAVHTLKSLVRERIASSHDSSAS